MIDVLLLSAVFVAESACTSGSLACVGTRRADAKTAVEGAVPNAEVPPGCSAPVADSWRKAIEAAAKPGGSGTCATAYAQLAETRLIEAAEHAVDYAASLAKNKPGEALPKYEDLELLSNSMRDLVDLAERWESEALNGIDPRDDAAGKLTQQASYDIARRARRKVEEKRQQVVRSLDVALVRFRRAKGGKACSKEQRAALEALGVRLQGFDAVGLRVVAEQLKATGAGTIPGPVAELLDTTAKVAVKRAKRAALGLVHDQLELRVCGARWPEDANLRVFPNTCAFIKDTTIETLAKDPRRVQPALVADLVQGVGDLALTRLAQALERNADEAKDPEAARAHARAVAELARMAVDLVGRVRSSQVPKPSHVDAQALLTAATRLTDHVLQPASSLAIEGLMIYVKSKGERDIYTIIDDLEIEEDPSKPDPLRAERIRRAVELALLGIRGLGLAHEPTAADEHGAWLSAADLVLQLAIDEASVHAAGNRDATISAADRKKLGEGLRSMVLAIADENVPAAVSAASRLAGPIMRLRVQSTDSEGCAFAPNPRSVVAQKQLGRCRGLEKASALVSGVATYAATYAVAGQDGKSEAELRVARAEAIEDLVDATTRRAERHGDWVVSLGIPVGFIAGGQLIRERNKPTSTADGDEVGSELSSWKERGMAPQLEVPLGIGVQRLVGRRYSLGKARPPSTKRETRGAFADGLHLHISVIDLGQFLAYDTQPPADVGPPSGAGDAATEEDVKEEDDPARLSRPRWDSIFGIGAQAGWIFGRPDHSFVLAATFRYAPTLFAETQGLVVNARDEDDDLHNVAGAMRFGITLAYYVALFDFN